MEMRYKEWKRIYEEILRDFGYDRAKDEEAARVASEMMSRKGVEVEEGRKEVERLIRGREVVVCGNAPCLEEDIMRERGKDEDIFERSRVIAADGATSVLLQNAIMPDIIVTDLDGNIADIIYASRLGSFVVVHAHGDNIKMIRKVLPELGKRVICTTQSKPLHNVYNFGGFTDGDRCVFLAREFGAKEIKLIGFDFEDRSVSEEKRKKLKWAKKLIFA
ncbi:MAG: 6-hydroxymethylpterin diphosphokinase MptE-like protein [Candidatus Methanospirareceae archaeon]